MKDYEKQIEEAANSIPFNRSRESYTKVSLFIEGAKQNILAKTI